MTKKYPLPNPKPDIERASLYHIYLHTFMLETMRRAHGKNDKRAEEWEKLLEGIAKDYKHRVVQAISPYYLKDRVVDSDDLWRVAVVDSTNEGESKITHFPCPASLLWPVYTDEYKADKDKHWHGGEVVEAGTEVGRAFHNLLKMMQPGRYTLTSPHTVHAVESDGSFAHVAWLGAEIGPDGQLGKLAPGTFCPHTATLVSKPTEAKPLQAEVPTFPCGKPKPLPGETEPKPNAANQASFVHGPISRQSYRLKGREGIWRVLQDNVQLTRPEHKQQGPNGPLMLLTNLPYCHQAKLTNGWPEISRTVLAHRAELIETPYAAELVVIIRRETVRQHVGNACTEWESSYVEKGLPEHFLGVLIDTTPNGKYFIIATAFTAAMENNAASTPLSDHCLYLRAVDFEPLDKRNNFPLIMEQWNRRIVGIREIQNRVESSERIKKGTPPPITKEQIDDFALWLANNGALALSPDLERATKALIVITREVSNLNFNTRN